MHALVSSKCPAHVALVAAISGLARFVQQPNSPDLSDASLEDLMNIQVTSVSKKEQKLSKAGAAIFVVTQAPGVDVARVDADRWAISIRALNDQHANKVLMLIDGRSVYGPSLSGVFRDMVDVPLETIDRIEVIRGPGGTVGAQTLSTVLSTS